MTFWLTSSCTLCSTNFWLRIIEKAGGELAQKVRCCGDFPKQQSAGVRADHSAVKAGDYFPCSQVLKAEQVRSIQLLHPFSPQEWQ